MQIVFENTHMHKYACNGKKQEDKNSNLDKGANKDTEEGTVLRD